VKGLCGGVILLISTTTAWTTHKTIPLGCLSHLEKRMHAFNEIFRASIGIHPCSAHLHYISTYQMQIFRAAAIPCPTKSFAPARKHRMATLAITIGDRGGSPATTSAGVGRGGGGLRCQRCWGRLMRQRLTW
jgi:hypothetical protein